MGRLIINMIDDGNGNQKRGWGLRGPQDNKTISNSNVSMRLFGSTGEPDGRGGGIWGGGRVLMARAMGGPAERKARIKSAPPAKRAAGAAGKCLVGQQPSEPGGALDERGHTEQLRRGKESKSIDINEPSLMDIAHDMINSTQVFATTGKAVVEVKPIAMPTIKYEIWPLLKDLMEWPRPPKSAYVIGAWLEIGLMVLISYPVGIIRMESPVDQWTGRLACEARVFGLLQVLPFNTGLLLPLPGAASILLSQDEEDYEDDGNHDIMISTITSRTGSYQSTPLVVRGEPGGELARRFVILGDVLYKRRPAEIEREGATDRERSGRMERLVATDRRRIRKISSGIR
ncbi:hypothetical protein AgCh_028589 [Apium graveolens]